MDTEQKQRRFLYAGLTILFLAAIFLYSASLFDQNVTVINQIESPISFFPDAQPEPAEESASPMKMSTLDWKNIEFDACGGQTKYNTLPWWDAFSESVSQTRYYDDRELALSVKRAVENDSVPQDYTLESYCALDQRDEERIRICNGERYRNLSMEDFREYGEGCLSRDGLAFVAVFPGVYMGEGAHLFRYDVKDNILEEAEQLIDEKEYGLYGWNAPPASFGKRVGSTIKMFGGTGDAGCGVTTEFTYDYVANTVEMMRRCSMCDGGKPVCESF